MKAIHIVDCALGDGVAEAKLQLSDEEVNSVVSELSIAECAKKNIEPHLVHLPWGYAIDGFMMAVNARNGIYPADTEGLE